MSSKMEVVVDSNVIISGFKRNSDVNCKRFVEGFRDCGILALAIDDRGEDESIIRAEYDSKFLEVRSPTMQAARTWFETLLERNRVEPLLFPKRERRAKKIIDQVSHAGADRAFLRTAYVSNSKAFVTCENRYIEGKTGVRVRKELSVCAMRPSKAREQLMT